jgi:hypothetical protein
MKNMALPYTGGFRWLGENRDEKGWRFNDNHKSKIIFKET